MRGILCFLILSLFFAQNDSLRIKRNVDPQAYSSTSDSLKSYAIVIDAGSSGSRVYAYWWSTGGDAPIPNVQNVPNNKGGIVSEKDTPGISTYSDNPNGAAKSIELLLNYSLTFIPANKLAETHVMLLATV